MVLHYAEAKFANMLRTTRSLLLVARRHLRKDIRHEDEMNADVPKLEKEKESGDVEEVDAIFEKLLGSWEKVMVDVADVEEKVVLAEGRSVHKFSSIEEEFAHLLQKVQQLSSQAHNEDFKQELNKIVVVLVRYQTKFKELVAFERDQMAAQYRALLSEAKHERGEVRNLVVTVDEKMQTMRFLWKERSLTNAVKHDIGKIEGDEHALLVAIHAAYEEMKGGKQTGTHKLAKLADDLGTYLNDLHKDWEAMIKMFLLLVKMIVNIDFTFEKDGLVFPKILAELGGEGFPQNDLAELTQKYNAALHDINVKDDFVVDVARRMMRNALGEVTA